MKKEETMEKYEAWKQESNGNGKENYENCGKCEDCILRKAAETYFKMIENNRPQGEELQNRTLLYVSDSYDSEDDMRSIEETSQREESARATNKMIPYKEAEKTTSEAHSNETSMVPSSEAYPNEKFVKPSSETSPNKESVNSSSEVAQTEESPNETEGPPVSENGLPGKNKTGGLTPMGLQLFEDLRSLRREIAKESGFPPYRVFSDRTLVDMCVKLPANEEEMLHVFGVASVKYEKYGKQFLEIIRSFVDKHPWQIISRKSVENIEV